MKNKNVLATLTVNLRRMSSFNIKTNIMIRMSVIILGEVCVANLHPTSLSHKL